MIVLSLNKFSGPQMLPQSTTGVGHFNTLKGLCWIFVFLNGKRFISKRWLRPK